MVPVFTTLPLTSNCTLAIPYVAEACTPAPPEGGCVVRCPRQDQGHLTP